MERNKVINHSSQYTRDLFWEMNPNTCNNRIVNRDPGKGVQEMHGTLHHKAHKPSSAVKNIFIFGSNGLPECHEGYSGFTEATHTLELIPRLWCVYLALSQSACLPLQLTDVTGFPKHLSTEWDRGLPPASFPLRMYPKPRSTQQGQEKIHLLLIAL